MNAAWEKRKEFDEIRKLATWVGLRMLYPKMSDGAIADLLTEMCEMSERQRYRLYHESRKYRVKKVTQCVNQSDHPALPL